MFIAKKIITALLLPPGIFVFLLLGSSIWLLYRKMPRMALFNLTIGITLWLISLAPFSNALVRGLESGLTMPANISGDLILLLGGGNNENIADLTGTGSPSHDSLDRAITAMRLHQRLGVPIVISGGNGFRGRAADAPVIRRFLLDLGVKDEKLIIETRSRDTQENALYCLEIAKERGYKKPILVTSAYHMARSVKAFKLAGMSVTPVPSNLNNGKTPTYSLADFMPQHSAFQKSVMAFHEYLGIFYYRLFG